MVTIDFDTREVAALSNKLALFGAAVRAKATGRGLAKVAKQGATAAKQGITKEYNVKSAEVAKRMSIGIKRGGMQVEIKARARSGRSNRIPLINFGAKGSKKQGVTVTVSKSKGKQRLRHAFVLTMPNGHTGVFARVPGQRKIKELSGIDVTHMMVGKRVLPGVLSKIKDNMTRVVAHELRYELSRLGFK